MLGDLLGSVDGLELGKKLGSLYVLELGVFNGKYLVSLEGLTGGTADGKSWALLMGM